MASLRGPLTYRAYWVDGQPPKAFKETYQKEIQRYAFRDIDVSLDILRSVGWVSVNHLFDRDFSGTEKFLWNQYIRLTFRADQLTIPSKLFKAYYTQKEQEYRKKNPQLERIPKRVKDALKQQVREEIIQKGVLPKTQDYEMVWNLNSGQVFFFTTGKRVNEEFMDLFQKTFGLSLIFAHPLIRSHRSAQDQNLQQAIESLNPSSFCLPG